MPLNWKIFYLDGTYSNKDGPPEFAPKLGVQAIILPDFRVGRRIERSEDFYIWSPKNGGWRGANHFRLSQYLYEPGFKLVLFGETLTDDDYAIVLNRAMNDPELPPKSGRRPEERI